MGSEQPKAILFDMDDTIATWDAVAEKAWHDVSGRFASRIPGIDAEKLYTTIKETRDWYMSDKDRHRFMRLNLIQSRREMVTMSFKRLGINAAELANEIADSYGIERERAAFVLPGATETLKHFRKNNISLALLTNGTSVVQRRKIERYGLSPFFDFIFIEGELGYGKPDERVFRQALKMLKISPAEAWMVGDDLERDIGGAKQAGIFGIWVDWRGGGLPQSSSVRPDKTIRAISELT